SFRKPSFVMLGLLRTSICRFFSSRSAEIPASVHRVRRKSKYSRRVIRAMTPKPLSVIGSLGAEAHLTLPRFVNFPTRATARPPPSRGFDSEPLDRRQFTDEGEIGLRLIAEQNETHIVGIMIDEELDVGMRLAPPQDSRAAKWLSQSQPCQIIPRK